ncbi:MAG: type-F conjugative transfer system pilin assembly protein TrbC [Proteobacteria bacterium]|nr:type-F conjugative transfer system pilin assembly protein TrbC [Pseudomonadota bacterium]
MKNVIQYFLMLLSILAINFSFANFNDEVNAYKQTEKTIFKDNAKAVDAINSMSQAQVSSNLDLVNNFIDQASGSARGIIQQKTGQGGKAADGAMLFISFSMPKSLIIQMSMQAAKYHIPVIIRGLVDNKMPKTLQYILDIQQLAKKENLKFSGVSIDPVWFDQFDITAVPALVVTQRPANCIYQKMCPNQPFDVVYGNQSIHDSLMDIADNGSAIPQKVAKAILAK